MPGLLLYIIYNIELKLDRFLYVWYTSDMQIPVDISSSLLCIVRPLIYILLGIIIIIFFWPSNGTSFSEILLGPFKDS